MVWGTSLVVIILSFLTQISPKLLKSDDKTSKRCKTGNIWRQDPVIGFHLHSFRLQTFVLHFMIAFMCRRRRGGSLQWGSTAVWINTRAAAWPQKEKIQQGLTQKIQVSERDDYHGRMKSGPCNERCICMWSLQLVVFGLHILNLLMYSTKHVFTSTSHVVFPQSLTHHSARYREIRYLATDNHRKAFDLSRSHFNFSSVQD